MPGVNISLTSTLRILEYVNPKVAKNVLRQIAALFWDLSICGVYSRDALCFCQTTWIFFFGMGLLSWQITSCRLFWLHRLEIQNYRMPWIFEPRSNLSVIFFLFLNFTSHLNKLLFFFAFWILILLVSIALLCVSIAEKTAEGGQFDHGPLLDVFRYYFQACSLHFLKNALSGR